MNIKRAIEFLRSKPGYLKTSDVKLALMLNISEKEANIAKKAIKIELKQKGNKSPERIIYKSAKSAGKKQFKRLFFDIETSYNTVGSFTIGYNLSLSHQNILKERAIICVCYKWEGESKVHSLQWNKGDDKQLLIDFIKILDSADEIAGHNSDKFDIKWLRTRCLYHNLPMFPEYNSIDTLKLARTFYLNSKRLDYIGQFLGEGKKLDTGGFSLWKRIIEENDPKAMDLMIKYCKQDVVLLEKVFTRLSLYTKAKTHVGVVINGDKCSCPNCGNNTVQSRGILTSATGLQKRRVSCKKCHKYYYLPISKE